MKVELIIVSEMKQNKIMEAFDMTDNGKKVFVIINHLEFETSTQPDKFSDYMKSILSKKNENFVFIYAKNETDDFLYFREDIQTISNGENWMLLRDFIKYSGLDTEVNENMTVREVKKDGIVLVNEKL